MLHATHLENHCAALENIKGKANLCFALYQRLRLALLCILVPFMKKTFSVNA